jgi:hypothetical protein
MHRPSRRGAKSALNAAAIVIGLLLSTPAQAFCRSTTCDPKSGDCTVDEKGGAPLTWRTLPLVYRFHRAGSSRLDMSRARHVIRRAFDTWEDVRCNGKRTSLRFVEGPDVTSMKPLSKRARAQEPFGIYFRDDQWPYDDGDESLAITSQTFGMYSGYIDYADIEINTTERAYAVEDDEEGIDLQAVVTHEIGHYIGLAHSNVADSIMVSRYCQSGTRCGKDLEASRALADDDIAAVCAMYPPSGIAGVAYEPEGASCAVSGVGRGGERDGRRGQGTTTILIGSIALAATRLRGVARRRLARG